MICLNYDGCGCAYGWDAENGERRECRGEGCFIDSMEDCPRFEPDSEEI